MKRFITVLVESVLFFVVYISALILLGRLSFLLFDIIPQTEIVFFVIWRFIVCALPLCLSIMGFLMTVIALMAWSDFRGRPIG